MGGEGRADVEPAAHPPAVSGPQVLQGLWYLCSSLLLALLLWTVICHKATSSPVVLIMVANKLLAYLCAT